MDNIVIVSGGFDPIHKGHIKLFQEAAVYGRVFVLLNSDYWLKRKKGRYFMDWKHRAFILNSFECIDSVLYFNDDDDTACYGLSLVRNAFPTGKIHFANGGDRKNTNTPEVQFCQDNSIELLWNIGGDEKVASSSELLDNYYNKKLTTRPWGYWRNLDSYGNVKTKEIVVYPEEQLSLQRHKYRNEFWVVKSGVATIINNEIEFKLHPPGYCVIEKGKWHQLKNESTHEELKVIEVQFGTMCVEEDIERQNVPEGYEE